jgi:hypothetical protein
MKKYYWITFMVVAVALVGCKDDEPTGATGKLEGTWSANGGQVLVDGVDHTSEYASFSITFTETKSGSFVYTVENGGHAFSDITVDTWYFDGNSKIVRGKDEVEMSYSISDNVLTLEFFLADPFEGGRSKGVFGDFAMKLKKQ